MSRSFGKYVAIGALCLAIGIAGTAGAAKLITGRDIKNGSIEVKDLSRRARKALRGEQGPKGDTGSAGAAGPQGPAGVAGTSGAAGAPGTSGSTAPALMLGSMGVNGGSTSWALPIGSSNFGSEPGALAPIPEGEGLVARDFSAVVATAPGAGKSVTITLRLNQANTALSCTISDTSRTCSAPADTTLALPAGALLSMTNVATAGISSTNISWGFRIVF